MEGADENNKNSSDDEKKDKGGKGTRPRMVGTLQRMENETLLEGLQNILDDYRDGSQILREMVQNAEDAGATCFKIMYDDREINPGEQLDISHYFKGPGLCVYNDALFQENDWRGIRKIGTSWKKKEQAMLKIGRFGQGFKSAFHITDFVILLSGKQLLIIDPLRSEENKEECTLVALDELLLDCSADETFSCLQDKFGFNTKVLRDSRPYYNGTLFWFSFRSTESPLSSNIYTEDKVHLLLKQFEQELPLIPMFLTNLKCIEIQLLSLSDPSSPVLVSKVKVENRSRTDVDNILQDLEYSKKLPVSSTTSVYDISITTMKGKDTKSSEWTVAHCIHGLSDMSDQMQVLCGIKELSATPVTAFAHCHDPDGSLGQSGHIFCFLPLPLSSEEKVLTGLPVNVNAFFGLEHNRCHVKYKTDQDQDDNSLRWNTGLLQELLPTNYIALLDNYRENCKKVQNPNMLERFVARYYDLIPDPRVVYSRWHSFLTELFIKLLQDSVFFTRQHGGKWVPLEESTFVEFQTLVTPMTDVDQDILQNFLLECGLNVVRLPDHVKRVLKFMDIKIDLITPSLIRNHMKENTRWQKYPAQDKLAMLTFIIADQQYDDLEGLEILPLCDQTFATFSRSEFESESKFLLCRTGELHLFHGVESRLVCIEGISETTREMLRDIAEKGIFQMKSLRPVDVPNLLIQCFEILCTQTKRIFIPKSKRNIEWKQWIIGIWKYIVSLEFDDLTLFEAVPLVPIFEFCNETKDVNDQPKRFIIKKFLPLRGNYMYSKTDSFEELSKSMKHVLTTSGMKIIHPDETICFPHKDVSDIYIKCPSFSNIMHWFEKIDEGITQKINDDCNDKERIDFGLYLQKHFDNIGMTQLPLILQRLKIFYQTDNVSQPVVVSKNDNSSMLAWDSFPVRLRFPYKVIQQHCKGLFLSLGGHVVDENTFLEQILIKMRHTSYYSIHEKQSLIVYLKDHFSGLDQNVKDAAKNVEFMPSLTGKIVRVRDLFNPTERLKKLFIEEEDNFPDEGFIKNFGLFSVLEQMDIKSEKDLSSHNLMDVVYKIKEVSEENRLIKSKALLGILLDHPNILSENDFQKIGTMPWLPIVQKRSKDYPNGLEHLGEISDKKICAPIDAASVRWENLVGSTKFSVDIPEESEVVRVYKLNDEPEVKYVFEHFKNVRKAYNENDNSKFVIVAREIFDYFQKKFNNRDQRDQINNFLLHSNSFPTNQHGFKDIRHVVIQFPCCKQVKLSLEPYIFEVSKEFQDYKQLLTDVGVYQTADFQMLKNVLCDIQNKYIDDQDGQETNLKEEANDKRIVVEILHLIVEMNIDKDKMSDLFVPIQTSDDKLRLEKVKNCTYAEGNSRTRLSSDVVFVHPDIWNISSQLGITSVTTRTLNKNTIFSPWGQKCPLLTVIKNSLDSYSDGFSIAKELLQNAEDAKATRIYLLYDERENLDHREGLFDKGMKECQGQALWVFNDAKFAEKDFENILKHGGKTKLHEKETVGKFGIGFSAVYNVTDVPCFISGKTLVVLDPHLFYLGQAIQDKNPGVRVVISKEIHEIYFNQFMPFDGVFGVDFSEMSNNFDFEGTLFRLPLRTQSQASKSEIRNYEYGKRDITDLFDKVMTDASNLLLFTQHVKEIRIYHLNRSSTSPKTDTELLFKATKCENTKSQEPFLKTILNDSKRNAPKSLQQIIDISYEVTDHVRNFDFRHNKQRRCNCQSWVLSWNTGKRSFVLAEKLNAIGAVPYGSIAVPIKMKNEKIESFFCLSDVPEGFYNTGHIFCSLPLPICTKLPVHINGQFMVEKDRKNIITYNEDNTKESIIEIYNEEAMRGNVCSEWNDLILSDVIQSAYVDVFPFVVKHFEATHSTEKYWSLWPKTEDDKEINKLVKAFYKSVICEENNIFFRRDELTGHFRISAFENAVFLDPYFRNESPGGQIAFDCLVQFHLDPASVVMDMPQHVFEEMKQCCPEDIERVKTHFISKFDFFKDYFLQELDNGYWTDEKKCDRNELLKVGLEDKKLHDLIRTYNCIPVKASNKLQIPSKLVSKTGSLSVMFDEKDDCFVIEEFESFTGTLISLGMMSDVMAPGVLHDRAVSVMDICDENYEKARERSKAIMEYLNTRMKLNVSWSENEALRLKDVQFLNAMPRPDSWPPELRWKNDNEHSTRFYKPEDLYLTGDQNLVGSVALLADNEMNIDNKLLEAIGVKRVTPNLAVEQLYELVKTSAKDSKCFKDILLCIYEYLDAQPGGDNDSELHNPLIGLQNEPIVLVKGDLVAPLHVAFSLEGNCAPYFYKLEESLTDYSNFWSHLGIKQNFELSDFIEAMRIEKSKHNNEKIDQKALECIVSLLINICGVIKLEKRDLSPEEEQHVYIPDQNNVLVPLREICYDDGYVIPSSRKELRYVHDLVVQQIRMIDTLKIFPKRKLHFTKFAHMRPKGQKEKLVTRLKGIVSSCSKNHSVMNELLQNADDAGATEIHFVHDMRTHKTDKIFDAAWAAVQGPSLTVFNNAYFTDEDIEKIYDLGEGSKSEDPTKVGQFGIGFNAVYHLTDVPSFLSRGPNQEKLCVFDPHCAYAPMANEDFPGFQFDSLQELECSYKDVYETYLQNEIPSKIGTWFRLPLRSEDMASNSKIKKDEVNNKIIEDMVKQMKSSMKKSLLFLTNIKQITISCIKENANELSETYRVFAKISEDDMRQKDVFSKKIKAQLNDERKNRLDKIDFQEIVLDMTLTDSNGYGEKWMVVEAFGFQNPEKIPENLKKNYAEKTLMLQPRGGVARFLEKNNERPLIVKEPDSFQPVEKMEINGTRAYQKNSLTVQDLGRNDKRSDQFDERAKSYRTYGGEQHKAFCFLPLPINTGLPVHVNAHFALDQNRSRIEGFLQNDIRYVWNKTLITEIVSHSYATLLQEYKRRIETCQTFDRLRRFFDCFPCNPHFDEFQGNLWQLLTFSTFREIAFRHLTVFPICLAYNVYLEHKKSEKEREENFEIEWVSYEKDGELVSFDDIHRYFKSPKSSNKRSSYADSLPNCTCDEEVLRKTLIEIGMAVTCSPMKIFRSIEKSCKDINHLKEDKTTIPTNQRNVGNGKLQKKANNPESINKPKCIPEKPRPLNKPKCISDCICPKEITPVVVMNYLKTMPFLEQVQVRDTKFKTLQRLLSLLRFVLLHNHSTTDENKGSMECLITIPLLVSNDDVVSRFQPSNDLILSQYCDLLQGSKTKFVHAELVGVLEGFEDHFRSLDVNTFADLLPETISKSKYYNSGDPVGNFVSDETVSDEWLERLWMFLGGQDEIDNGFKEWYVLPYKDGDENAYLTSISHAYTLFRVETRNVIDQQDKVNEIVGKMKLPTPNENISEMEHVKNAVASVVNPVNLVNCLYYHNHKIEWSSLQPQEHNILLKFFVESMKLNRTHINKLKQLPIFETITGEFCNLDGFEETLVVKADDTSLVLDGVEDLCKLLNTVLIKFHASHEPIYHYLGCTLCYSRKNIRHRHPLSNLYCRFILPNFDNLSREHHLKHLKFIQEDILTDDQIEEVLQSVRFVPSLVDNTLRYASRFFDPHNELFSMLCNSKELPAEPFNDKEWEELMTVAGYKTEITEDLIIRFARQIQQAGITEYSVRHSEVLARHLFRMSDLEQRHSFLEKISQIEFIVPYQVDGDYSLICEPFTKNRLISFRGGQQHKLYKICWTMEAIIPEYAIPENQSVFDQLHISKSPEFNTTSSHIHKVCESLRNLCLQKSNPINGEFIKELVKDFYDYLDQMRVKNKLPNNVAVIFEQTPLIYHIETNTFVMPSSVVLNLQNNPAITGLLLQCSQFFGQYFELFKKIGVCEEVSFMHYYHVLKNLKKTAGNQKLTLEELNSFILAFQGVFFCLESKKNDLFDKDDLYFLNEDNVLKLSREMVVSNRKNYRKRIEEFSELDILCDLTPLRALFKNPESLLLRLPDQCRPLFLTDCLKEEVVDKELAVPCDLAAHLERFLSGDEFQYIVQRLLKSFERSENTQILEVEYGRIFETLKIIRVIALPELKTILKYKSKEIKRSMQKFAVFFVSEENIIYVGYQKKFDIMWLLRYGIYISKAVYSITNGKIDTELLMAILPFMELNHDEIKFELDNLDIAAEDYEYKEISWYPLPGTPVQQEDIVYLSADFTSFTPGEYAVCKINDTDVDGEDDSSIYIYVKIVKKIADGTFPLYLVNTGDDLESEVPSNRLYKMVRTTTNELEKATCASDDFAIDETRGNESDVDEFDSSGRIIVNPQPKIGRVWIKQAKNDIEAARESLYVANERTYNWVCVMSHQAAEKALKAVQHALDTSRVNHDHFLWPYIPAENGRLQDLAGRLERLVGNYSRMRYPKLTSFPKTPSDLYSKEDAEQSVELASQIVDIVESEYF